MEYGDSYNFFPESFILTPYSFPIAKRFFEQEKQVWIGKPALLSRGRGIVVTDKLEDFIPKALLKTPTDSGIETGTVSDQDDDLLVVVQKYVTNPHLIGGYKHDLRLYVLVTSFNPLTIHIYNEGLSRFCSEKYSLEDFSPLKHLTNTSIHHKLYRNGKLNQNEQLQFTENIDNALGKGDFTKRRLRSLFAHLRDTGADYTKIWNKIQQNVVLSLLPLLNETEHADTQIRCFELLGFDFLLNENLDPILLEINMGPSLEVACETDMVIKYPLLTDMLSILSNDTPLPRRFDSLSDRNQHKSGEFDQIFPFNAESEQAAKEISKGTNIPENIKRIIQEMKNFYQQPTNTSSKRILKNELEL